MKTLYIEIIWKIKQFVIDKKHFEKIESKKKRITT